MSMDNKSFNKSAMTQRTPPGGSGTANGGKPAKSVNANLIRSQSVDQLQNTTKSAEIPCNTCEMSDIHTKLLCGNCKRWFHLRCDTRPLPTRTVVNNGQWVCEGCSKPDEASAAVNDTGDVTRVNLTDQGLLGDAPNPLVSHNSTKSQRHTSHAPSNGSRKTRVSKAVSLTSQEQLELVEKDLKLAQRQLEIEAELSRIRIKRNEIRGVQEKTSRMSSNASSSSELIESEPERRRSVEKCQSWLSGSGREVTGAIPRSSRSRTARKNNNVSLLNPEIDLDEFIDDTLHAATTGIEMNLSRAQVNARQVVSRDLPPFNGDPRDWPAFICKLRETTRMCGISASENLERLSRCLKGQALEAVKSDLHNPEALPNVLSTLKLLFGRPEIIYHALIAQVRSAPSVKVEKFESVVTFAMRVKTLCDTLKSAGMDDYLVNPPLLIELTERLPSSLQLRWSDHNDRMRHERVKVSLETFSAWLRKEVEKVGRISGPLFVVTEAAKTSQSSKSNKPQSGFQGAHQVDNNAVHIHCKVCDGSGHVASECKKFVDMSNAERWGVVRKKFMCIRCLGKHVLRNCGLSTSCESDGCTLPHHPMLHSNVPSEIAEKKDENKTVNQHEVEPEHDDSESLSRTPANTDGNVLMHSHAGAKFQIVPVNVSNGEVEISTYAFLDSGSNITIVERKLMSAMGISGPTQPLKIKWSGDVSREEKRSQRVQFYVSNRNGNYSQLMKNVRTVEKLQLPVQSISNDELHKFKHLQTLPIVEYSEAQPQILIGVDNHSLLVPLEVVEGHVGEPVAIRTRLGWTIFGNTESNVSQQAQINIHLRDKSDLHQLVDNYFAMENIGIKIPTAELESNENARARRIMEETINQHPDGKYEIGLLWKSNDVILPNSYGMALNRLKCFEKRLAREPKLRNSVNDQLRDYHDNGYLEELNSDQQKCADNRVWYLPIFVVTNPNKPGKERLVWDAAATVREVSLNSHLLSGPDLAANLVAILFKFRERRYAIGGDIKQMFHQIRIRENDQDVQRCLWREEESHRVRVSKMTVATFGAACSPSIAQFVKNHHAKKYVKEHPRAVDAIINRHYVDDYVDSFDTVEEGRDVAEQVARIHGEGGFYIRGFVSNNYELIQNLPQEDSNTERQIETSPNNNTKILGMWWDTASDMLRFKLDEERIGLDLINGDVTPTKRMVLRIVMMVFDPLGLLSFLILKGKLVVKAIWRTNVTWDEQINDEEMVLWKQWLIELRNITNVEIRRWYFVDSDVDWYELHVFVDAGEEAAAAVAYVVRCGNGCRESVLISSKSKVAPNRCISIPRMELQAAVIGVRLSNLIKDSHSLKFRSCSYWTDSRNVLCWIRSPQRFKIFVAHRISEIRDTSAAVDWRWVPSKLNPADHVTKWRQREENTPPDWFSGPEFIRQSAADWPAEPSNLPKLSDDILEVRCNVHIHQEKGCICVNIERFSSINRLLRSQARVLKFVYRKHNYNVATVEDLKDARTYVTREVQIREFPEDYQRLKDGKLLLRDSKLKRYSPFMDPEGLIRMRSRLQEAEYLTSDQCNPIILPAKHHYTYLTVNEIHKKYWHANSSTVLNEVRQVYMIPALRSLLQSVRSRCQVCKNQSAKPEVPEMSDLPRSRLAARMRPFSYVGVDCFGPMFVRVARRTEKRWGVLYTCLTTRAIHLEITSSMSSDAFILNFRCFVGRRGEPIEVYCDNGTNFRGANTELKAAIEQNLQEMARRLYSNVKFKFNPPNAPHMGGAWERLIRSVKVGLRFSINDQTMKEETLRATLIEIEMVINSRPLTYVQTDESVQEALTPNHFLLGHSSGVKPIGNMTDDPEILKKEWKRQQLLVQHFWTRWTNEYLPEISRRTKWYDTAKPLKNGDVVAVMTASIPNSWQLGRVIEITKSKDGNVRQAVIQTSTGVLRRPASKLAVLEREEIQKDEVLSAGGSVAKVA